AENSKAIVGRWFTEFWGKTCNLGVVDELAAPDMLLQYSLHEPRRGQVPLGNDSRVVAVHEASHAETGVILGQPVVLITPRLTTYRAQRRSARECYHAAVVALAGRRRGPLLPLHTRPARRAVELVLARRPAQCHASPRRQRWRRDAPGQARGRKAGAHALGRNRAGGRGAESRVGGMSR